MSTPRIFSSTFLPCTGEPIDFLIVDREEPIHGTFDDGIFHSRWANYDSTRVRSWRQATVDSAHELVEPTPATARRNVFASLAHVALRLVGKGHRVAPALTIGSPARRHVTQSTPCVIRAADSATKQYFDSNQISS